MTRVEKDMDHKTVFISHRGKWNIHSDENDIFQICRTIRQCMTHPQWKPRYYHLIVEIDIQVHREDPCHHLWLHHDSLPLIWKEWRGSYTLYDLLENSEFQELSKTFEFAIMLDLKYEEAYSPSVSFYLERLVQCLSSHCSTCHTSFYVHSFHLILWKTWAQNSTYYSSLLSPLSLLWGYIFDDEQAPWSIESITQEFLETHRQLAPVYMLFPKSWMTQEWNDRWILLLNSTFSVYRGCFDFGIYTLTDTDDIPYNIPHKDVSWYVVDDLERRLNENTNHQMNE